MKKLSVFLLTILLISEVSAQWVQQNSGTANRLNSVYFINSAKGFAVGDNGTILRTIDGGTTWNNVVSGRIEKLNSVYFVNDTMGFIAGSFANVPVTILKTIDGGVSWFNSAAGAQWSFESIFFTDVENGYATGGGGGQFGDDNYGRVFKTTNGGLTWSECFTDGSTCFNASFTSADTGFVFTSHITSPDWAVWDEISKTTDGGKTWNNYVIKDGYMASVTSVFFTSNTTGYAVCWDGQILKSIDGGITWAKLPRISNYKLMSVFFTNPNTGYAVGNSMILKTVDAGANWESQGNDANAKLISVYFPTADIGYAVGESGLILKTTNGGSLGLNENQVLTDYNKLYPNPAKDKITIETSATENAQLSILNVNGQQIIERKISKAKTVICINNLPAGIFFVKIRNRNRVEVFKLIKE